MFHIFASVDKMGRRLFTVPYFFVRSLRYTASYRHGYLDFQMYRGGGRRGLCKMGSPYRKALDLDDLNEN